MQEQLDFALGWVHELIWRNLCRPEEVADLGVIVAFIPIVNAEPQHAALHGIFGALPRRGRFLISSALYVCERLFYVELGLLLLDNRRAGAYERELELELISEAAT